MAIGVTVRAQGPGDDAGTGTSNATGPGLCLEVASSIVEPGAWSEILDAFREAADGKPSFFPDAAIVTLPDLAQPWDSQAVTSVRIGIWSTGGSDPGSTDQRRGDLASADCTRGGSDWAVTISHDLVLAAGEEMLAGARLPQGGEEPIIPGNAETDLELEFHPAEQRVRTILEWSREAFFIELGGWCWIDDVLGAEAEQAVVSSSAGLDVTFGSEAGCELFQDFLDEVGLGERALQLLPTEIVLADGTVIRFGVGAVEVQDSAIALSGPIERS
jgi:hypothetical protein